MNKQDIKKIERNLVDIKANISDIDNVVDHLIEKGTISLQQRPGILRENATPRDKCQNVIDHLIKAGPAAYDNFLNALKETDNCHLVEQLEATNVGSEEPLDEKTKENFTDEDNQQMATSNNAGTENNPVDRDQLADLSEKVQKIGDDVRNYLEMIRQESLQTVDNLSQAIKDLPKVTDYVEKLNESANLKSKLSEMKEQYRSLQSQQIKLKEALEDKQKRLKGLNSENHQLKKQVEELTKKLANIQTELDDLKKQMQETERQNNNLEKKKKELEHGLEELRSERKRQLEERDNRIEVLTSEKNDTNNRFTAMKYRVEEQGKTIELLYSVIDELSLIKNKPVHYFPRASSCANGNTISAKNINNNLNQK